MHPFLAHLVHQPSFFPLHHRALLLRLGASCTAVGLCSTVCKCAKCVLLCVCNAVCKVEVCSTVCTCAKCVGRRVHHGSACSGCQGRGSNKGLQGPNFSPNIIEQLKWSEGSHFVRLVNLWQKTKLPLFLWIPPTSCQKAFQYSRMMMLWNAKSGGNCIAQSSAASAICIFWSFKAAIKGSEVIVLLYTWADAKLPELSYLFHPLQSSLGLVFIMRNKLWGVRRCKVIGIGFWCVVELYYNELSDLGSKTPPDIRVVYHLKMSYFDVSDSRF